MHGANPFRRLASRWTDEAETFRRYGDQRGARTCEVHAEQLEKALRAWKREALTLEQAAEESGYTAEHLGRLVREGTIPNAGEPYAPRILRRDLPRKPGHQAGDVVDSDDPVRSTKEQIARRVVNSDPRGGHDG